MAKAKSAKPRKGKAESVPTGTLSPADAKPRGRPTVFTQEIADHICALLREGRTLTSICKEDPTLPAASTVRSWAVDTDNPFSAQYAKARESGYHAMADELMDIAEEKADDAAQIARNRLRVDTRKWLLSKALPKIYGDKLALTDADGGTLKVQMVA